MAAIPLDLVAFRALFPAYSNPAKYPDALIESYYTQAGCYISNNDSPCSILRGDCLALALNLMTAHLLFLADVVASGKAPGSTPGLVVGATIDMITVTLQAPPAASQWQWWLNLSPYGQRLLALLQVKGSGGFYIGGRPERSAFRGVGGVFR